MTGEEFIKLIAHQKSFQNNDASEKELVKGRTQLAKKLSVSVSSIIHWENQGIISPETQTGRIIIYNLQTVMESLKNHGKK